MSKLLDIVKNILVTLTNGIDRILLSLCDIGVHAIGLATRIALLLLLVQLLGADIPSMLGDFLK